jgi:hypothetical protein
MTKNTIIDQYIITWSRKKFSDRASSLLPNKVSNLNFLDLYFADFLVFKNRMCHDSATKLRVLFFRVGHYE